MGTLLFGKAIAHNFDIHSKTWYFMSFLLLSTATGACACVCACVWCVRGGVWLAARPCRGVRGQLLNLLAASLARCEPCMRACHQHTYTCTHAHTRTLNDTTLHAAGLEIATILVPHAFLVLGSCANMIKGLSWMAGGSTRSVFNLSFVRDNNIAGVCVCVCSLCAGVLGGLGLGMACRTGVHTRTCPPASLAPTRSHPRALKPRPRARTDITAKNTSQYIFASLFGTAAGVSCCAYIGQSAPLALLCFSALAWTSLYSAYRTVNAIPLPTLNSTRLQLLAARCVRWRRGRQRLPQSARNVLLRQQRTKHQLAAAAACCGSLRCWLRMLALAQDVGCARPAAGRFAYGAITQVPQVCAHDCVWRH
jgi:hypothetical protein